MILGVEMREFYGSGRRLVKVNQNYTATKEMEGQAIKRYFILASAVLALKNNEIFPLSSFTMLISVHFSWPF